MKRVRTSAHLHTVVEGGPYLIRSPVSCQIPCQKNSFELQCAPHSVSTSPYSAFLAEHPSLKATELALMGGFMTETPEVGPDAQVPRARWKPGFS
jgi:hypothetical protein